MTIEDSIIVFETESYEEAEEFLETQRFEPYQRLRHMFMAAEMDLYKSTTFLDFRVFKEEDLVQGEVYTYNLDFRRMDGNEGIHYFSIWGAKATLHDEPIVVSLNYLDENFETLKQYIVFENGEYYLN
ncbi:hypothetical protein [Bacillus massiliigorillae]|uniref:hypothetical protein n=1 Tax=Bacillus massiliigorillae TaxID=1243664 RepID=UPI0003A06F8E|nr:hypothetical protein [Bacillus massiliigorillae]